MKRKQKYPAYVYTRNQETYERLMKLDSRRASGVEYRKMLDLISPGDYVEAPSAEQGGEVLDIIRNMYGFPVCVMVKHGSGKADFISVDRIEFWEQYQWVPGFEAYDSTCEVCWEWEE